MRETVSLADFGGRELVLAVHGSRPGSRFARFYRLRRCPFTHSAEGTAKWLRYGGPVFPLHASSASKAGMGRRALSQAHPSASELLSPLVTAFGA